MTVLTCSWEEREKSKNMEQVTVSMPLVLEKQSNSKKKKIEKIKINSKIILGFSWIWSVDTGDTVHRISLQVILSKRFITEN